MGHRAALSGSFRFGVRGLILAAAYGFGMAKSAEEIDHVRCDWEQDVLEQVPVPVSADRDLPDPARWPVLRYQRPLQILVIADKNQSLAAYRRIALRLRSRVDYCYAGVNDQVEYHVNDK